MTNTDLETSYRDRLIRIEERARESAEEKKEIGIEMRKNSHLTKSEILGIKKSVKRHFETLEQRLLRETSDSVADALGDFKDLPLGRAAVLARNVTEDA